MKWIALLVALALTACNPPTVPCSNGVLVHSTITCIFLLPEKR